MTTKQLTQCDTARCQNCGFLYPISELNPDLIERIHERVEPGEIMPAGECPSCEAGALMTPTAEYTLWGSIPRDTEDGDCYALSVPSDLAMNEVVISKGYGDGDLVFLFFRDMQPGAQFGEDNLKLLACALQDAIDGLSTITRTPVMTQKVDLYLALKVHIDGVLRQKDES